LELIGNINHEMTHTKKKEMMEEKTTKQDKDTSTHSNKRQQERYIAFHSTSSLSNPQPLPCRQQPTSSYLSLAANKWTPPSCFISRERERSETLL
jgi:hypothetical protein